MLLTDKNTLFADKMHALIEKKAPTLWQEPITSMNKNCAVYNKNKKFIKNSPGIVRLPNWGNNRQSIPATHPQSLDSER